MIQTLNKHIKWRKDNEAIFICDCKRLINLKLPFKYESFLKSLDKGVKREKLNNEEKKVLSDFEKMKLLSKLEFKRIKSKEFGNLIKILDNELGKERVRDVKFLYQKLKEFPEFFIGVFLDKELVGIICGFPREDYLLISEIAIDSKFHRRGFGKRLVEEFEEAAKYKGYKKINVGSEDSALNFYKSLSGYKPFLLIQFKKEDYLDKNFDDFNIIKKRLFDKENIAIEVEITNCDLKIINQLRKKYPKAWFQYIFTKQLK